MFVSLINIYHEHLAVPTGALRKFTRDKSGRQPLGSCDFCHSRLSAEHRHLLSPTDHALICICDSCLVIFGNKHTEAKKYCIVPQRYLALPDFQMSDEQWDDLMLPVNIVYIFQSSVANRATAFYPSPAGATESLLPLEHWEALCQSNPILYELLPDVEALLINRLYDKREYNIVPIDACYQLVGLIRSHWRGLSGGEIVWQAIDNFFTGIHTKATTQSVEQTNMREGGADAEAKL